MAKRSNRFVIVALATLLAFGCRVQHASDNHAQQQIMYTSMVGDPRTFNPLIAADLYSATIVNDVFESLIRINEKTALPEPDLAESWDIASDQKSITFHLRRGLKWMDGAQFTSHDVAFTVKVIYDTRIPCPIRSILLIDDKEMTVETPDDYTVTMRLPRPFAPLLYSLLIPIIPAHILEPIYNAGKFNQTWNINTPPKDLVGLGPFQMTRYVPAQLTTYTRNPYYWEKDDHGGALPRLHGEGTLIVPDQNAGYLKFLSGQTDIYGRYDLRPDEVIDLRSKAQRLNITLQDAGVDNGEMFFAFNRNPRHYVHDGKTDPQLNWFTDLNFMRALAHSIDKQGMISLCYHGMGVPAWSCISPANKLFYNPNLKDYDFNLKEAAQILEDAGYHVVRPGVRVDPKGNPLEFNLTTSAGVPMRIQMCAIFKQDLATLGIKVNLRPLEFTTLIEKVDTNFDWDSVLMGFTGTIDPNGGSNYLNSAGAQHLWNPREDKPATPWEAEIDKLLAEGTMEMDTQKRVPYYWRIQEIMHDQLPVLETVLQEHYVAYTNKLENVQVTPLGYYRPEYIQFKE